MENQNEHFRHILYYYIKRIKKAKETIQKLCAVYGKDTLTERTYQIWFRKFRSGNSFFRDRPRSCRPIGIDDGA